MVDAIDEVLCSLGEPVKSQIYTRLEKDFSITRKSLPGQIEEFSKFLYRVFGPHARLIEIQCMRTFYSKIKIDQNLENLTITCKDNDFTLLTYIKKFRASS